MAKMKSCNTLSPCGLGAALGLLFGVDMFLHVVFAMNNWQFMWYNSAVWALKVSLFPWLQATWMGALLAFVVTYVCGTVCGTLIAWIYNKVVMNHTCTMCK